MSRIIELAAQIQQCTSDINAYIQDNNLPQPSFDEDAPTEHVLKGEAMLKARDDVLGATLELHQLLLGPAVCLRPNLNGVSLQVIYKYDISTKVPLHGEISFSELADKTGLTLHNIRRILRFAMVYHRIFKEPREGYVAHTAASRRIRDDPITRDGLGYMSDEIWPSYAHTVPAMEQWQSEMPNETGWNHYHNSDKRFYEYHQLHPAMAKRFAGAMASFVNFHGNAPSLLAEHYPWDAIGKGTVVDVGGSKGHISVLLAQKYPNLDFIVQDLPEAITGAVEAMPSDVADRIQFQEHDFFEPQMVQGDVYLFRNIFHNWPDAFAIQIIQQLVPALRKGSRIVIHDYLLPRPGTLPLIKEMAVREMDLVMLTLTNAREREEADWIELFENADSRFGDVNIRTPAGATMSIIEVVWGGDERRSGSNFGYRR